MRARASSISKTSWRPERKKATALPLRETQREGTADQGRKAHRQGDRGRGRRRLGEPRQHRQPNPSGGAGLRLKDLWLPQPEHVAKKSGGFEVRKEPGKGVHIRRKAAKRKAVAAENGGRMNAEKFVAADWIDRLAEALARLAGEQERYSSAIPGFDCVRTTLPVRKAAGRPLSRWTSSRSVCAGARERDHRRRGKIPSPPGGVGRDTWRYLEASRHGRASSLLMTAGGKIWVQIEARGDLGTLWNVVDGLMARAMELPENGFRVAASELNALLPPEGKPGRLASAGI